MNGESKPTLRPLLFVILFGVLVTSIVTAFRSGLVQIALPGRTISRRRRCW